MKKLLWVSIILTLGAIIMPALLYQLGVGSAMPEPVGAAAASVSSVFPSDTPAPADSGRDRATVFSVETAGEVRQVNMEEYLPFAVAAEIPASFSYEAIKAQAVAARTYIKYCAAHENPAHPEAAVCSDPGCCLAFMDENALRGAWGAAFKDNLELIKSACAETDGETIVFEGEPVLAAFHSSSAGRTEDGKELWGDVPYLKSVESPETAANVPEYVTTAEVSALNFKETILLARPDADFSGWPEDWLGAAEYDDSGRIRSVIIGGVSLSGQELRSLFSLRSTAFTLECRDRVFYFTVTGFGHGLGMSQYGADVLARGGNDYRMILSHYYPNTQIQ